MTRLLFYGLTPSRFARDFKSAGVDPDRLTIGLQRFVHRKLHSGRGRWGGTWNLAWEQFFNKRKGMKIDPNEILEYGAKMMYAFGIL